LKKRNKEKIKIKELHLINKEEIVISMIFKIKKIRILMMN